MSKKINPEAYGAGWGAFQKNPTPKAVYERSRRQAESMGFNAVNMAIDGKQRSQVKTLNVAVKTIHELKREEGKLLEEKKRQDERLQKNVIACYKSKYQ